MIKGIHRILFNNVSNPPFAYGDIVNVFYDTTLNTYVVYKNDVQITSGPTLGAAQTFQSSSVIITNFTVNPINDSGVVDSTRPDVKFCSGTTLITASNYSSLFPYASTTSEPNHSSCAVSVCDIAFNGAPVITQPTDPLTADGSISVVATSSNTGIRYTLLTDISKIINVVYNNLTNTTGSFTGLLPSKYFVVAMDSAGCKKFTTIVLNAANVYNVRWRMEFDDINGWTSRVDILQLNFAGSLTEVKGTEDPFQLILRGENENLFTPILTTESVINLISETNFEFIDLFTQNDREFKINYYKNIGSGLNLKWTGWVTPSLYQEENHSDTNYQVSANATDGVMVLDTIPFTVDEGITGDVSLIKFIAYVLQKTDLTLPIHVAVNVFESSFATTASDDPLAQSYLNVEGAFFSDDNDRSFYSVLSSIMTVFGARLYQFGGAWKIDSIYSKADTYAYRVFDYKGTYVSNSTFNPIVELKASSLSNRAVWVETSQNLEINPAIGKVDITFKLVKNEWGFTNGGFEKFVAPASLPGYIAGYPGWSLIPNGNIASFAQVSSNSPSNLIGGNDSTYRMVFHSDSSNTTYGEDAYILSEARPITYSASDAIKLSFDFFTVENPKSTKYVDFVKFKWSFRVNNMYLQGDGSWETDATYQWVEVNIEDSEYNKWNSIEVTAPFDPVLVGTTTTSDYQLRIMTGSFKYSRTDGAWEYDELTGAGSIEEILTVDLPLNYVVCFNGIYSESFAGGLVTIDYSAVAFYTLTSGDAATSLPDSIRPTDYSESGATNIRYWKLVSIIKIDDGGSRSDRAVTSKQVAVDSFDNAKLEFFPSNQIAPDEKLYSQLNNQAYKENQIFDVELGDVPLNVINGENIYLNVLKNVDGDSTQLWTRTGFSESMPLISLLAKQRVEQLRRPSFKLTGNLTSDVYIGFDNTFKDSSRYYLPMGMTISERNNEYSVELHEIELVDGDTANPFSPAEFVTTEFGQDFDI